MNTEKMALLDLVKIAITCFNMNERYSLENDLSERCICAKFAAYLQEIIRTSEYKDYIVDVEYNRGTKEKDHGPRLLTNSHSPITVDLIVHKRGHDTNSYPLPVSENIKKHNNLICIEMKKSNNCHGKNSIDKDKTRLFELTCCNKDGYSYIIGIMIIAQMKECELSINEVF